MRTLLILLVILCGPSLTVHAQNRYFVRSSKVGFVSRAPLETIVAESAELKGVIDMSTRTFAFSVSNRSFKGFNSPLQLEHFNENYMEADQHPVCTFTGKIIDDLDANVPGIYEVRVKGMLMVKGIERERIIKSKVEVKPGRMLIQSDFTVILDDYMILIPRVVSQKIAPEIAVSLQATLMPRE